MKRVLIIRPSAIGDIVMASPLIAALRNAWPDAYIAWLVDPSAQDLLRYNPALDAVICWSKGQWHHLLKKGRILKLGREVIQLRRQLKKHRFNLTLDVQGLLRSRILSILSGADERWGFESKEPGRLLMTRIVSRGPDSAAMSSEYRFMTRQLGIEPQSFQPEIVLSEEMVTAAKKRMRAAGLSKAYAVLCPFTTRPQKHWFNERWAKLAELLYRREQLQILIMGGPHDLESSQHIVSMSNASIHNITAQTTIGESAAIIQNAALVVGVDTGLTHMGTAFRRPTIAMFGATCPYLSTESPHTRIVYYRLACSPCKRKPTCDGRYDCMRSIQVETVLETARKLLHQNTSRAYERHSH